MKTPKFILGTSTHYLPSERGAKLRLTVDIDVSAVRDFIYESRTFAAIGDPEVRNWPNELYGCKWRMRSSKLPAARNSRS